MEEMTNCFGVNIMPCNSCKRMLPMQQDNVMRTYFVAPPAISKVVDTLVCEGYINNGQQKASNEK